MPVDTAKPMPVDTAKPMPVDTAKPAEPTPAAEEPKKAPEEPKKDAPAEPKTAEADAKLSDAELAEIKKLPADDQAIAIAQKTCPVSGDHLGMDVPIKKVIGDTTFFICCAGCEKTVAEKPQDVLAKLKK